MLQRLKLLERLQNLARRPIFWIVTGLFTILLAAGVGSGIRSMQAPPPQPLDFNHQVHVGLGIQCLYCHPGAWRQAAAGLPTTAKCWGCHQQMANTKPAQQVLVAYAMAGESIPWVPVFIQPDFVYFNHRPHIAAGLNCENCHGEISRQTVAQPIPRQNMGWCLDCHRGRAAGDEQMLARLTDCATCHR
ncbi:MAG: cytochrome c3 family protein [Anaerolineales bacterium]|nr:cytochrome c3 family protein [Anaerolineales bacterium]